MSSTAFQLGLPTDIPWKRICVTEDMLDDDICDMVPWTDDACLHPDYPDVIVTWKHVLTHRSALTDDVPLQLDNKEASYGPSSFVNEFGDSSYGKMHLIPSDLRVIMKI